MMIIRVSDDDDHRHHSDDHHINQKRLVIFLTAFNLIFNIIFHRRNVQKSIVVSHSQQYEEKRTVSVPTATTTIAKRRKYLKGDKLLEA